MKDVTEDQLDAFLDACHRTADRGLVCCSSGNLSLRLDGGRMLATASRSWLGRLTRDQVSLCRIADRQLLAGPKPSVEIGFHAGILKERADVHTVLHFQSPYATTLACCQQREINYFVTPEIPFYIGPIGHIPYAEPGTPELAQAVVEAAREHDMVVMGNHGLLTVAHDVDHALQNAEFFELACRIILQGREDVRPIPDPEVQRLLALRKGVSASAI